MGVDFLTCGLCDETFGDCGYYEMCHRCNRDFCDNCCKVVFEKKKKRECNPTDEYTETGYHSCLVCDGKLEVRIYSRGYDTTKYEKSCNY